MHAQWDIAQFHEQYYHNLCNHVGHVRNYSRVIRALYNNMRDTLLHMYVWVCVHAICNRDDG